MKILLSVPQRSFVSEYPVIIPDTGLGYLATVARRAGHGVSLLGWNMDPAPEAYQAALERERPDIVGIKVFTKDVGATVRTIALIRAALPGTVVVVGGPHPSSADPDALFHDLPGADFAIRGEGEIGLPRLMRALGAPQPAGGDQTLAEIPGLVWKRPDGSVAANPTALTDLDAQENEAWDLNDPRTFPAFSVTGLSTTRVGAPFITSR